MKESEDRESDPVTPLTLPEKVDSDNVPNNPYDLLSIVVVNNGKLDDINSGSSIKSKSDSDPTFQSFRRLKTRKL